MKKKLLADENKKSKQAKKEAKKQLQKEISKASQTVREQQYQAH